MALSRFFNLNSERTSKASSLPFEIWNYISQFLPDDQLCELYSVNRALFHIALPLRYNKVSLSGLDGFIGNIDAGKYSRILEDPSLGKHIRVLTLDLTEYGSTKKVDRLSPKGGLPRIKALVPIATYYSALLRFMQKLRLKAQVRKTKSFVASLDQVTSLVIRWHQRCPLYFTYNIHTDIFLLGWSTFGSRLRSLSLHITTGSFRYLFGTNLHLPQLDTLTLDLYKCHDMDNLVHSSPKHFINFIRRHLKTLTSLRIISLSSLDREAFYAGIGELPNLRAFGVEEIHQRQELSPLTSFLILNSATLTEFSWSLELSPKWKITPIAPTRAETPFDTDFPELRKLTLNFTTFQHHAKDVIKIVEFVKRHAGPLTSLTLSGERFIEPELHVLLDIIQISQLRTLEISLYHIRTSTFPALANHLPYLETLTIIYENFGMDVFNFPVMDSSTALTDYLAKFAISDLFVKRMQMPSVRNWRLHTLSLKRRSYLWDCSLEYVVAEVIVKCIPHLKLINGMERRDFLRFIFGRSLVGRQKWTRYSIDSSTGD